MACKSHIYLLAFAINIFLTIQLAISIEEMEYPEVYFEGYQSSATYAWEKSGDFSNVITREGDDFSLIDSDAVRRILITCRAPFPIYWEMGDVQVATLERIFTHSKVIYEEIGTDFIFQEFQSYLDLHNIPGLTGDYKCRSISDGDRGNSIYVFLPGTEVDSSDFTFPTNQTTVGLNGAEEVLILPCKVTRKETNASLLLWEDDNTWVPASLNAEFNPKKGFIVNLMGKQERVVGRKFKCSTEEDAILVDVKEEYVVNSPFPYLNSLAGNATWKRRKIGVGVQCCSNSSTPPGMLGAECDNQPHCEMVKQIFMNIAEPKGSSYISNLFGTYNSTFRPQCVDSEMTLVKPFLLQCFGDGINLSAKIINEFRPSVLLRDTKMKYIAATPFKNYTYSTKNTIKITTLKKVVKDDYEVVRDFDMKRHPIYEGDRIILDCCGLVYQHALGRIQRIVWENGTFTRLLTPELHQNESEEAYPDDHCFSYMYYGDEENYFVTVDVTMRYFECMVPVWNDVQPVIKRIDLHIRTKKPLILANNETTINITYDENQVGILSLDCGMVSGDPPPKMTWMKDGQKILQTDEYASLVKDSDPNKVQAYGTRLLFMRAAMAITGEYNCTGESSSGKVEKLFYVEVKQCSYLDYWIAFGIFGTFFVIIICCGLRVSNLDKPSFSKKIEPEMKQEQKLDSTSA